MFIGERTFVRSSKDGTSFIIYATPISGEKTLLTSIPKQYKDFEVVFQKKNADILSKHRPHDCAKELQEGAQPSFGSTYNLLQTKLTELQNYIDKNPAKNFICHSKSPTRTPILFVKKKRWLLVDVHGLLKSQQGNKEESLPVILDFKFLRITWACEDLYKD